jgi:seryl-tRNA synthetase
MVFLEEVLTFLLTALQTQGYSYVSQLIALDSGGRSTSATKELYNIKQVWNKEVDRQVLINTQTLMELQSEADSWKEQAESYEATNDQMANEIEELRAKLNTSEVPNE